MAAKSGKVTFASPGNGTTNHLAGVLLESMSKVEMTHVPYRGAAPAMNDVVSGTVNFLSGDFGTLLPMVNAGKRYIKLLPDGWTVVTKDRGLSAQWEHTVLVTPDGHEVLTLRHEERGGPSQP